MLYENQNQQNNKRYVRWAVFVWTIGIILILFGVTFNGIASLNVKMEARERDTTEIKMDVREIKTNVTWIMEEIKNNK